MKSKVPAAISAYFSKQGKKGGKLSGPARMKKLTPEQRAFRDAWLGTKIR